MERIRLGKTNLMVSRSGFGGIPIWRLRVEESTALLKAAFAGGINYYDTARYYGDSEQKIGLALSDVRNQVIIASKSFAKTGKQLEKDLETSLLEFCTDYIDVYQFHNPPFVPRPGEGNGLYDTMLKAKTAGKIKHIGISVHRLDLAMEIVKSELFETLQYPMSFLATENEIELIKLCKEHDMGFIAMKALAGGLITNAKPAFAFLRQFDNVVPIWGMQYMPELEEFLGYERSPPALDGELWEIIRKDKEALSGNFCRGCGYCQPCSAGIVIQVAARMELMLGRSDWHELTNKGNQEIMRKINDCIMCGQCREKCPYHLDISTLLKSNLVFYNKFIAEHLA